MKSINQLTLSWAEKNNLPVFFKPEVDSTNTWAKKDFQDNNMAVFLTDSQNQGRGRNNNTWTNSNPGSTLLSTWCLKLKSSPQPVFPLRVGLALYESFKNVWPQLPWALKAPNDIYLQNAKLAGILIEAENTGAEFKIFIGIGANIFAKPKVDQPTAHLREQALVSDDEWFKFCFQFVNALRDLQMDPQRQNLLKEEQDRLLYGLQKYAHNDITLVENDGSLLLKNGQKTHWSQL